MSRHPLSRTIATLFATAGLALGGSVAAAPKIDKIEVSAQPATVGQPVKITVQAIDVDETPCAVQMDFGDGKKDQPQKTGGKFPKFPRTWEHTYSKPGKYTLVAEGARAGNILGCIAKAKFDLNVEPAPVNAAPPPPAAKAEAKLPCPTDWVLKGKAGKDGSFTCIPAKGVKNPVKPEKALECPAGTGYFTKGKTLGCEKQ